MTGLLLLSTLLGCAGRDCDPGVICTWFGTPKIAGLSEDGVHRLEASTFWVVDVAFHPTEGWPVIMELRDGGTTTRATSEA